MPTRFFLPLALLASSFCAHASVDSGLLALVPTGSKVLGAIDVVSARDSELGQYLLAKSSQASDAHFLELMEKTGFDPRRDLQSLMFASEEPQGAKSLFVILARGTFDEQRIESQAKAHGASVENFQGVDIMLNPAKDGQRALAFIDVGIAAFGDPVTLRQIISTRAIPTVLPPLLRGNVEELGRRNDMWFAALTNGDFLAKHFGEESGEPVPQAKVLQSIVQSSGGVRLAATIDVTFHAVTRSPQDANALADVIHFLASMVQMQRQNDARADLVASSLDTMDVQTDGNAVSFSLSMPEKKVERLAELAPKPNSHVPPRATVQ